MKNVNNEQALLAILLLLLTSLSTVSGSMPTIQSIETYFEESKPNKELPLRLNEPVETFKRSHTVKEKFGVNPGTDPQGGVSLDAAYGLDKEDIKELNEEFKVNGKSKEHFSNCGTHENKENFSNCGTHENKNVIEPFQGNLYATV